MSEPNMSQSHMSQSHMSQSHMSQSHISHPRDPDQRVPSALRQLASARSGTEQVAVNRAESTVIALLLPVALELGADRPARESSAHRARIIAARLTRAVLDWDPCSEPPELAAMTLVTRALPPVVTSVPVDDGPATPVAVLPAQRSARSAVVRRDVPRAG